MSDTGNLSAPTNEQLGLVSPAPAPSDEVTDAEAQLAWDVFYRSDKPAPFNQLREALNALLASRSASEDTAIVDWLESLGVVLAAPDFTPDTGGVLDWRAENGVTLRGAIRAVRPAPEMEQDNG